MSTLNPHAAPFVPQRMPTVEEEKSLFMTFSHGSPLNQQEISDYFNSIGYGECVESVSIHGRGREAMSGNIVFRTVEVARLILGNEEVVKICVKGKPVWLKKYIPRAHRVNP